LVSTVCNFVKMPKEKELYLCVPRLLRKETLDRLMLGYVLGYRNISPIRILQVRAAIKQFIDDFELTEDDFPLDSAVVRFYNLYSDLNEMGGTQKKWKLKNGNSSKTRPDGSIQ